MNKIYKAVWNESLGTWVAASEASRSKTKRNTSRGKLAIVCAIVAGGALTAQAHAADDWTAPSSQDARQEGRDMFVNASAKDVVALGANAQAPDSSKVATDGGSVNSADRATAMPAARAANLGPGIQIGNGSQASGPLAMAAGINATADQEGVAAGAGSEAGSGAIAAGTFSKATGQMSVAVGEFSMATELDAIAVGESAAATGASSIAVGAGATASADNAIAVGNAAQAQGAQSVAAGMNAVADAQGVAVGSNSAAGIGAIATGDLASATGQSSVAVGEFSMATKLDAVAVGDSAEATGESSIAVGAGAAASQDSAIAVGNDARANGKNSFAAGTNAVAGNTDSIAIGTDANANGLAAVALGQQAVATGDNALAIGTAAQATANSVALGAGSVTAIGARSSYTGYNLTGTQSSMGEVNVGNRTISGVAPGLNDDEAVNVAQLKGVTAKVDEVATSVDGAVKYDRNPDGTVNKNSFTLEGDPAAGGTAIHNVAAGVNATDAVNLGQLNDAIGQVSNAVINAANPFFSAEGERDTEGALVTGTHAVAAGASASASGTDAAAFGARASASGAGASAFGAGASASGTGALAAGQNAAASGNGATALGNGAQASADNSVALGQNSVADRANSVSVGTAGHERQITNVAAGTQGTDAVNVDQLSQSSSNTLKQANDYTNSKSESTRRDAYAGTAAALAVAGLPQAVLPGRGMVAIGGGTYGGQSAVALGVSQLSDNGIWAYKVTGTTSTRGEFGVSLGAGMHW